MNKHFLSVLMIAMLAGTAGCDGDEQPRTQPISPVLTEPVSTAGFEHPTPIHVGDEPSRLRNRLTIDQLNTSIRRVTGGIGWEVGGVDQFEVLAPSLGVPDYATSTQEDLEPSALFQKFLGDAARFVCSELSTRATREAELAQVLLGEVEVDDDLTTNEAGVMANLSRLVLRFHGQSLDVDSPELQRWRWLFESSHAIEGEPMQAWNLVCVGLITHPDFYTY